MFFKVTREAFMGLTSRFRRRDGCSQSRTDRGTQSSYGHTRQAAKRGNSRPLASGPTTSRFRRMPASWRRGAAAPPDAWPNCHFGMPRRGLLAARLAEKPVLVSTLLSLRTAGCWPPLISKQTRFGCGVSGRESHWPVSRDTQHRRAASPFHRMASSSPRAALIPPILLWDVSKLDGRPPATMPGAEALSELWPELRGNAASTLKAITALSGAGDHALTLIKEHFQPRSPRFPPAHEGVAERPQRG